MLGFEIRSSYVLSGHYINIYKHYSHIYMTIYIVILHIYIYIYMKLPQSYLAQSLERFRSQTDQETCQISHGLPKIVGCSSESNHTGSYLFSSYYVLYIHYFKPQNNTIQWMLFTTILEIRKGKLRYIKYCPSSPSQDREVVLKLRTG